MEIHVTNNQEDGEFGLAKRVIIKSFRQVSIFGKDYTKIVYRHSENDYSIEKVGQDVDPDENVQVISGPRAEEIIVQMIETEKARGSTFVWNGARFDNTIDETLLKDCNEHYRDPLKRDPVEFEEDRRKRRRRKEDRERSNDEIQSEKET